MEPDIKLLIGIRTHGHTNIFFPSILLPSTWPCSHSLLMEDQRVRNIIYRICETKKMLYLHSLLQKQENHYTVMHQYSSDSELIKPYTCCIWREKMFQHSAPVRDSLHFLEVVWVMTLPCKRKCFITRLLLGTCQFWHSLQVLEWWVLRYHCMLLCYYVIIQTKDNENNNVNLN